MENTNILYKPIWSHSEYITYRYLFFLCSYFHVFGQDDTLRILRREATALALTDLRVPESTLHPLNPSQQAAVKKALKDTFSVIQGPPGKNLIDPLSSI